ncbi:unnamed protein product [Miscanthus lutarioriparius]|uniref:Uncharacterized protein n=1 Tax=Miscanthus lutarioriparius TaxID=422564 RepID=A0A811QG87_9POAL|nr:unnamed protein product [Miscanthus lutarioriparius]
MQHDASGVKSHDETVNGPRWKKMQVSICNNGVLSALEKHSGGRWASSDIYQDQAQGWKVTLHTEKTEYRKQGQVQYPHSTVHAFQGTKDFTLPVSKELMEKLGMYLVSFDRSEYGEGDPNPKRDVKSKELDIKELADQLDLGQKLYVLGSRWEDTLFGDASSKAHR